MIYFMFSTWYLMAVSWGLTLVDGEPLAYLAAIVMFITFVSACVIERLTREREYCYLVSFSYNGGRGRDLFTRNSPINTWQHITTIEDELESERGYECVTVHNYQLVSKR